MEAIFQWNKFFLKTGISIRKTQVRDDGISDERFPYIPHRL
jgi:hypothetical protein